MSQKIFTNRMERNLFREYINSNFTELYTNGVGQSLFSGTDVPESSLGTDGSLYIKTDTQDVYKKTSGTWAIIFNIKGEKGDTGSSGQSAYQLAVTLGYSGTETEWIASLKGDKGDAATVSIGTVTTGDSGTSAAVTNSGTSNAAVFNFTIPKGSSGSNGVGISNIAKTSGTGAAGTTDTYTITMTDSTTYTFTIYNGADGTGGSSSGGNFKYGSGVPSLTGVVGDMYINIDNGDLYAMVASTYNGSLYWEKKISLVEAAGNKMYAGEGEPAGSLGGGNDFYINVSNGTLYKKTYQSYNGLWSWSADGTLKGSDGATPYIDSTTKHWMINGTDTGVVAEGQTIEYLTTSEIDEICQ